jgi:dolichol-phosphate mannosyltransferase
MIISKILKFSSVGALGSVTNIAIFSTLIFLDMNYNIASASAFLIAVTQNYMLNKHWTFKDHNTQTKQKFIKYFILNFSSFFINLAILNLFVMNFDMAYISRLLDYVELSVNAETIMKIIGQILGIAVAMVFNFLGSYLVIFAKNREDK